MFLLVTSSMLISLSLSLVLTHSPLAMGVWVLLIAFMISVFSGLMFNSWFAFIMFLIYIGGMLVMFAYFAALTPNQPLTINLSFILMMVTSITLTIALSYSKTMFQLMIMSYGTMNTSSITVLYSWSNSVIILVLASVLFFILVAVVKVTKLSSGPLRPFNYV